MKPILAPHKEQDGWQYWRLFMRTEYADREIAPDAGINSIWLFRPAADGKHFEYVKPRDVGVGVYYSDDTPGSRIISSRRVEEAVETADYLKRCADEGLFVAYVEGEWWVSRRSIEWDAPCKVGTTLRESFHRYRAAVTR
jgi:hypothetical protein